MKNTWTIFLLAAALLFASTAYARVITGLIDRNGNPVHSGDEFTLHVSAIVTTDPYGYRYTYDLSNDVLSNQPVWRFGLFFQDVYSVVTGTANTPWEQPTYPTATANNYSFSSFFSCDPDMLNPPPLSPGQTLMGYTFVSPYPLGIIKAYAEGDTNYPWYDSAPSNSDAYDLISPYGPGKVFATIGPVKPTTPNVTDNYSVIGCMGGICDVQLDITGPQDPYGTAYTYLWSGAFGSAVGAKPIVQLAAGAYNISVAVSDPYATLVTATMPVTVVDPNPPVIVNPPATGAALTPAQVAALTPTALAALTPTQVSSIITLLSPTQIALLAPNQLIALSPAQVQAVSALLTPAQLSAASSMTDDDDSDDEHSDDNSDDNSSDSNSDDESDEDDKSS